MKHSEYLKAGVEVLKANGWFQGGFARNAEGYGTFIYEDSAVCFCATGAIAKGVGGNDYWAVANALEVAMQISDSHRQLFGKSLVEINDDEQTDKEYMIAVMESFASVLETGGL